MILLLFLSLAMSIFTIALIRRNSSTNRIYQNFVLILNIVQIVCILLIAISLAIFGVLLTTNQSMPFLENDKAFVPFWLIAVFVLTITFVANVIYLLFYFLKWRRHK